MKHYQENQLNPQNPTNLEKINNNDKQVNFLESRSNNKIMNKSTFRPVGPTINSTLDVNGIKYTDEYSLDLNSNLPKIGNYGQSRLTR